MDFNFSEIEKKWQQRWETNNPFAIDLNKVNDKFYVLVMFPYPSGDKLHMGHWYQYGLMDTWNRFKKLTGKNVFSPMGFDAFGLPAENFAIKQGIHPDISTTKNVDFMINQFKNMGVCFDWHHTLNTSKPDYYKWTQWLFLQLYKKGLAYRNEAPVNWCPDCQTVLANEQVQNGTCERCNTITTRKNLKQWFFKITDYADDLLTGLETLKWPNRTKTMQKNWIGKSHGAEISFTVDQMNTPFTVFTTRPDTLFGVTYVTFAPEHPLVMAITTDQQKSDVTAYIEQAKHLSEVDRLSTEKEKTGVFTGSYAINPTNNERVPIWISDYVLMSYGTGIVMAVPAHDERDFAFAQQFDLPIKQVIVAPGTKPTAPLEIAFTGVGEVIGSAQYNGMQSDQMIPAIIDDLEKRDLGKRTINYRLRDWLISRQRYWGCPIPIVYCNSCGEVPIPEEQLPVSLPSDVKFKPTGESPLKSSPAFMNTTCPKCNGPASREADTLDTFVCSSWYYLRFPSSDRIDVPFDKELTNRTLPVDKYVGGPEHACMHLIYARFITMALKDMGFIDFNEPFPDLTHQGLVLGTDGQKMSKSRGNAASPDPYVEKFGSDTLRLYLCFGFNYVEGGPWDDEGIKAIAKFMDKICRWYEGHTRLWADDSLPNFDPHAKLNEAETALMYVVHNSIKMITADTDRFMFNTSIARLMELYNAYSQYKNKVPESDHNKSLIKHILQINLLLISPFAPHMAEEWWERAGNTQSIFLQKWPAFDEKYLTLDEIAIAVMINGKRRQEIQIPRDALQPLVTEMAQTDQKVAAYFSGKQLVKTIYVPGKLINFILK